MVPISEAAGGCPAYGGLDLLQLGTLVGPDVADRS
jgi:hypothetical protein